MSYNLDSLSAEYHDIEIPSELEFVVRTAMRKAENGEPLHGEVVSPAKTPRKNRASHMFTAQRLIGLAAALLVAFVGLANSTPTISQAMKQIPVIGTITEIVTVRNFTDRTNNLEADIHVPEVQADAPAVNDAIKKYTDTIIEQYKKDVAATNGQGFESISTKHTTVTDNSKLFALRFNTTIVAGDSAQEVKIYNVDKGSGAIVSLSNLFSANSDYASALSAYIKEQMYAEMEANQEKSYFTDSEEITREYLAKNPSDVSFYVDKSGRLVLVFSEGDVAPMYMGVVSFTIPSSVTAPYSNGVYLK